MFCCPNYNCLAFYLGTSAPADPHTRFHLSFNQKPTTDRTQIYGILSCVYLLLYNFFITFRECEQNRVTSSWEAGLPVAMLMGHKLVSTQETKLKHGKPKLLIVGMVLFLPISAACFLLKSDVKWKNTHCTKRRFEVSQRKCNQAASSVIVFEVTFPGCWLFIQGEEQRQARSCAGSLSRTSPIFTFDLCKKVSWCLYHMEFSNVFETESRVQGNGLLFTSHCAMVNTQSFKGGERRSWESDGSNPVIFPWFFGFLLMP